MEEEWKEIEGYPDYKISNLGKVMSFKWNREKTLRPSQQKGKGKNQYYQSIWIKDVDSKWKRVKIHRLVAKAFIDNPKNKPQVNHIDGNGLNNVVTNLEFVTCSENIQHAYKTGLQKRHVSTRGEDNNFSKLKEVDVVKIRDIAKQLGKGSYSKIGKMFGVHRYTISLIINRVNWKHI